MNENSRNQIMTSLVKIKPKFEEKDLGLNPFLTHLNIKVRHKTRTQKVVPLENIKLEEEIVTIGTSLNNEISYIVETEEKASIYTRSDFRVHINSMSPKAKSLFLWIIFELDYGKDYIWINVPRYLEETDTSLNTYKKAAIELSKASVIYPIVNLTNVFWINPVFTFKGNRTKKYKNHLEIIK